MRSNLSAGRSVRATSRRIYGEAASRALWAALLLVGAMETARRGTWDVSILLAGFGTLLATQARGLARTARGYRLGAISEERVGALLAALGQWGWTVEHDVGKQGRGNVDHVVHSPSVTFTIDTKRSRWRGEDLGQAHRHAAWASRRYGRLRPIVPVICVERSARRPEAVDGVQIVAAGRLVDFLLTRG